MLVPNGQSDDVLYTLAGNNWNPKHGLSITLGVMLAQARASDFRGMNDNDAEWPPEKVSEIFHDTRNKDDTVTWISLYGLLHHDTRGIISVLGPQIKFYQVRS
jgi:hypothetical protein